MNIKKAHIGGALQQWDVNDNRFDIEEVWYDVPLFLIDSFTDEEIGEMTERWYMGGDDWSPLANLLKDVLELGWFKPCSTWEMEDPCELMLFVKEEA